VRLLICGGGDVSAVARELETFLRGQGYHVFAAETPHAAVELAQASKPDLAFVPATLDRTEDVLELMQKLTALGVPAVLINAHGTAYRAADDVALARALARQPRRGRDNGNGRHH
jgi:DNA-binding MurR/RpiR family transcriptional regulator